MVERESADPTWSEVCESLDIRRLWPSALS